MVSIEILIFYLKKKSKNNLFKSTVHCVLHKVYIMEYFKLQPSKIQTNLILSLRTKYIT